MKSAQHPLLLVLYVEDDPAIYPAMFGFMKECGHCDPDSVHVRSRGRAIQWLEGPDHRQPDLVIMDRGILDFEDSEIPNENAGDELYYELLAMGLTVVVFSGEIEDLRGTAPYHATPPRGFLGKPITYEQLVQILGEIRAEVAEGAG